MKKLATITNESSSQITISYDNNHLYSEAFGEPTLEIGPRFTDEGEAVDYIHASYSRGWNLTWAADVD